MSVDWVEPYKGKRAALSRKDCHKPGVYLIRVDGVVRYIGMSARSAYDNLYRKFQNWNDPCFNRQTYDRNSAEVAIVKCSESMAARIEKKLIQELKPTDNILMYEDWSVGIEAEAWFFQEFGEVVTNVPF